MCVHCGDVVEEARGSRAENDVLSLISLFCYSQIITILNQLISVVQFCLVLVLQIGLFCQSTQLFLRNCAFT